MGRGRGNVAVAKCSAEAHCCGRWGVEDVGLWAVRRERHPRTLSAVSLYLHRVNERANLHEVFKPIKDLIYEVQTIKKNTNYSLNYMI